MRAFKSLKPRLCHEILTIELQMILLESRGGGRGRGSTGPHYMLYLMLNQQSAQIGGKSAIVPELSPDTDQEQGW